MNELKLKIGGIGISIKWEGSRILNWPHPFYEKFLSNISPQIRLNVHCTNLPRHSSRLIFDGKKDGYWRLYRNNSKYIVETFDTMTHKTNKVCFIEPDFSSGDVYVDSQSDLLHYPRKIRSRYPVWFLPHLMQPLGQLLLVNVLANGGGIMAHGLGINDRGKGIAFVGGSGAGKSTLAGLWKNQESVDVLSDEHIIIRKKNGQFWLYGTPWPGMAMAVSSQGVRLKKIFFIEHSSENKILGQATASSLFPLLFLPFWDKIKIRVILKFCEDLIKKINCKKLGFVKDRSVIDFVRGGEEK
jgi:hypothetical protein